VPRKTGGCIQRGAGIASSRIADFPGVFAGMVQIASPACAWSTELVIAMDHPAYYYTYLAPAERRSCDLVTADGKLSAKPLPLRYKVLGLTTGARP